MTKLVLVTGGNGQLGRSIQKISGRYEQYRFAFIDQDVLDLTDAQKTRDYLLQTRPDVVINCAAYTAVDKAETDTETCYAVNAGIPALLGHLAGELGYRLIHLSTDYVYDGNIAVPHTENMSPLPRSVYGKSKLAGEQNLFLNPNVIILRTSWLYSEFGHNFLLTMLRLGDEKSRIGVVYDQAGTPTYAGDLAAALLEILAHTETNGFVPGVYNYSNEGVCSWYDFACEIMFLSGKPCSVSPLLTSEYPLPAPRPVYSVMDKSAIRKTFHLEIPYWRDSLRSVIDNMTKKKEI